MTIFAKFSIRHDFRRQKHMLFKTRSIPRKIACTGIVTSRAGDVGGVNTEGWEDN